MQNSFLNAINRFLGRNSLINRYYTTQQLGSPVPEWINTSHVWTLYNEIPELQTVVNRYAKMIASANPVIVDKKGAVVSPNGHWIFKLIDRPNPMQSWGNLMFMVAINKALTNNALIYAPPLSLGGRQNLTPLAWNNIKIKATGTSLRQNDIKGFIEYFELPLDHTTTTGQFKPEEVVYICEPDGISLFNSQSKIDALKYPLSNIAAQYKKRNVLLSNLFTLGILSSEQNDGSGAVPLNPTSKKEIRDDLKARHTGEVAITDKRMKWDPLTFPTKDLMLYEELSADMVAIVDKFGLNIYMFGSPMSKGATFSNVEMGERQAYNSTIIPDAEIIYDEFTKQLGLDKEGLYLVPSFEHISVLQKDKTADASALLNRASALEKISQQLTLSDKEKRDILEM